MTSERELQIEALADRIRTKLYVYDSLPLDLKTMLRRIGDLDCCPRATIELLPQEKMKYDEAYTDGDTKTIFLPDTLPDQLGPEFPHNRFTVAHELGHIALGHSGIRSRALHGRDLRKQANISRVWAEESEANTFAGAFLVPTRTIIDCKTPEELVARCGVSMDVVRIRNDVIERRLRHARGEMRPIPDKTKRLIAEIFRIVGTTPKSIKIVQPEDLQKMAAVGSAEIQGFLPVACPYCGRFEFLQEGGCVTCQRCGESNCS